MAGVHPKKFLFNNRDFSEQGIDTQRKAIINAPPPPPSYSKEDIDAARRAGHKEGFDEATRMHKESLELKSEALLSEILLQLQGLVTAETLRQARSENDALKLALAMLEQLYPVLLEQLAGEQLIYDVQILMAEARGHEDITIHVHPEMLHALAEKFSSIDGVKLHSNAELAQHDVILKWPHGTAEIKRDDTYELLRKLVRDTLNGGIQDSPEVTVLDALINEL